MHNVRQGREALKARLIAQYGSQMGLMNLLNAFTRHCPNAIPTSNT
jgi:hypothetical protein